ncbi:MAG: hypothetical protein HWE18_06155 [Gammaproteobacteria bacterium]|nr:hypothetical protein [Gammaproteobacteria bacterium]
MKNYVSFNVKYYKHTKASGEIGHVIRQFADNKNSIDHLVGENFGNFDIDTRYRTMLSDFEKIKGKKFQANANTFMDAVLAFSLDQMEVIKKEPEWKDRMTKCMDQFGEVIKDQYGLQPVGFNFHCDEGHTNKNGDLILEDKGKPKMNYHAHFIFINYDPVTKQAPLRKMKRGDWSKIQDLAGEAFSDLGFERGISAEITGKRHLEKQDLIESSYKEAKKLKDTLVKECLDLTNQNMKLTSEINSLRTENEKLKALNAKLKNQIKKWVYAGLAFIKKSLKGFDPTSEAVKTILSEPDQIEDPIKKEFYDSIADMGQSDSIKKVKEDLLCRSCKKRNVRRKGLICTFCSSAGPRKNIPKLEPS